MYAPVTMFAIVGFFRVVKSTEEPKIRLRSIHTWLFLFILTGIIGLMIERSPFFVSHWSDDNRYLTPIIAPSTLLFASLLPQSQNPSFWRNQRFQFLTIGLLVTGLLVTIPRLLWQGSRKPMTTSRGLFTEGRFDLTFFYEYTSTPAWILDAQFFWHPFSERLTYTSYEVASLLVSCLTLSLLLWKWKAEAFLEEE